MSYGYNDWHYHHGYGGGGWQDWHSWHQPWGSTNNYGWEAQLISSGKVAECTCAVLMVI